MVSPADSGGNQPRLCPVATHPHRPTIWLIGTAAWKNFGPGDLSGGLVAEHLYQFDAEMLYLPYFTRELGPPKGG